MRRRPPQCRPESLIKSLWIGLVVHAASSAFAAEMTSPEDPPALIAMVQAPGGFPRVPTEAYLSDVETRPIEEVRALAKAGRTDAVIQLARMLWWNGNTTEPIQMLKEPAAAGVPVAQYLLSTYLRSRDPAAANALLEQAARRGHPIAQETLAARYLDGSGGLERSAEQAFRLYLEAGRKGLRNAQMNVGMMLCTGRGTSTDKRTGRKWFVSSQQGQLMPLPARAAGCDDSDREDLIR